MGEALYRISIFSYRIAVSVASMFNEKAKKMHRGRHHLFDNLTSTFESETSPIAWFHCASLGEFEQGRPIIERFKTEFSTYKILLTFFSPSGYEVQKDYSGADFIFYLPWDTQTNASKFIQIVNPKIAFFVKYEFWHYYILELHQLGRPILSVSSIFRPKQIYFKFYGGFHLKILKRISHFFVQTRNSEIILQKHNIQNITIAGDTRFDRVAKIIASKKALPLVEKFKNGDQLMVIGSCWKEDLEVLTPVINTSKLKFIIAPHEINGGTQKMILKDCLRKTILYSELVNQKGDEEVLVVDNIGLLSSLYGYGEYAYIGGAFGAGLHNILEAATYGVPIFFGNKNFKKFNEAVELIDQGGAVAVGSETELRNHLESFQSENAHQTAKQVNSGYVKDNTGATEKIIAHCKTILKQ